MDPGLDGHETYTRVARKQPGIEAHQIHSSALRDELLADQERMSTHILETAKASQFC